MNILDIPFHKLIGIKKAEYGDDFIYQLDFREEYLNHLGILHASALYTLADASSGEFLHQNFKDYTLDIIPVIRSAEAKYLKPATGHVFSKAAFIESSVDEILQELKSKKRVQIKVRVDIFDQKGVKIMTTILEWLVTGK